MAKLKYRYREEREMKDSGVEWLGMIPKEWGSLLKAKHIFKDTSIKNHPNEEMLAASQKYGVIPKKMLDNRSMEAFKNFENFKLVNKDNFVISLRSFEGGIEYSRYKGIISPAYTVLTLSEPHLSNFFKYLLKENLFIQELNSLTVGIRDGKNISYQNFSKIYLSFPSVQEQQKIADFLDLKTARFDSIIEKKEKLIEKLLEAKKSLISEVVTGKKEVKRRPTLQSDAKGIPTPLNTGSAPLQGGEVSDSVVNPEIHSKPTKLQLTNGGSNWEVRDREESEMKDSGVEWLGRIPKGWGVKRLKHFAELVPKKSEVIESKELECTFLPMEKLKTNSIVLDTNKKIDDVYSGYTYFQEDDILMAKVTPCFENRNICIAKNLTNKIGFGSSEIYPIRINKNNSNKFYFYHFMEETFINIGASEMTGAGGLKRVPSSFLNNMYFVSPTLDTQKIISDYLDDKTSKITTSIEKIKSQINKLKEAKKSLISEVVTGKIEVL